MTVLEDVSDFIVGKSPKAVCDDCIASHLKLSVRQHANHKTRELAETPRFERLTDTCTVCGKVKKVISYQNSDDGHF
jgi:hypothetical protein